MRHSFLMAMAASIALVETAAGAVVSVETRPTTPGPGDSMWLVVGGRVPDSCWKVLNETNCAPGLGDTVWVNVFTEYRRPPGASCLSLVMSYETECHLGVLSPGEYTVIAVEHRLWPRGEAEESRYVGVITVGASTPTVPARWGAIKARFE